MSDHAIASELSTCIQQGSYPESEEVVSSDLSPESLKLTLSQVKDAKRDLETEICQLSREDAPNIDEWIVRARQASRDIEKAKRIARDIVEEHEECQKRASSVKDAQAKIDLLKTEINFNDQVLDDLRRLKKNQTLVAGAEDAYHERQYLQAASEIEVALNEFKQAADLGAAEVSEILQNRLITIKDKVSEKLQHVLFALIKVEPRDVVQGTLILRCSSEFKADSETLYHIDEVVTALRRLGSLDRSLSRLSRYIEARFLSTALSQNPKGSFVIEAGNTANEIRSSRTEVKIHTLQALDSLKVLTNFMLNSVPSSIQAALAENVTSFAISSFISEWLTPSIPLELSHLENFTAIQSLIQEYANSLPAFLHKSKEQLTEFLDRVPRMWLTKRRMAALDHVRTTLRAGRRSNRTVERVERQKLKDNENTLELNGTKDEWDADWGDELEQHAEIDSTPSKANQDDDDSGWNFDNDDDDNNGGEKETTARPSESVADNRGNEDEDDAWGWGDETTNDNEQSQNMQPGKSHSLTNGGQDKISDRPSGEKEVVLKETYTITDIPEAILENIHQQVDDSQTLGTIKFDLLDQSSSAASLLSLPTLLLAMYRATAPAFYETSLEGGNMHLYNDSMFLVERLSELAHQPELGRLEADIKNLEKFGRMAYAREMDTQRTILDDLLDGAQGFTGCAEFPVSAECETAVNSTVDRLRFTHKQWKPILSHSALLQSTSSLLARVIDKLTKDILDMEDISDAESQRLAAFCNHIAELEDLFIPEPPPGSEAPGQETIALTALYVPNWLRFRYLAEILESKLVDIKYLWTEGELSQDFTAEEVVDLIKALFADTRHRKEAIGDIRRSSVINQ
ncbi:MAG: hypothetical protein Q9227_003304 [Pyrenula ochraceoflavens]